MILRSCSMLRLQHRSRQRYDNFGTMLAPDSIPQRAKTRWADCEMKDYLLACGQTRKRERPRTS